MNELVPATPEMADMFTPQEIQQRTGLTWSQDTLRLAIATGTAFAFIRDGRILGMGGISTRWEGCGTAWVVASGSVGATMVAGHRTVARALEFTPHRRVEAYVYADHPEGIRWVRALGFSREGLMRCFHNGQDFELWARVREG